MLSVWTNAGSDWPFAPFAARLGWRQLDLSRKAGVSQSAISLAERGHLESMTLAMLRRIVRPLDGRAEFEVRWRGADLERLLDARHAAVADAAVRRLRKLGWVIRPEVSYESASGRGWFDALGFHPVARALANIEVKADMSSLEATLRKHDEKDRVARVVALQRFGWHAEHVGRILVLPETMTARRQVARFSAIFDAALPERSRAVLRWLRTPDRDLAGIWFLSPTTPRRDSERHGGRDRVRVPRAESA